MNQNQPKKNAIWMIAVPSVGALLAIGILALVWFTEIEDGKQSDTARTETTKTTRSTPQSEKKEESNVDDERARIAASTETPEPACMYKDLRTGRDGSGVQLETRADIDKLSNITRGLYDYLIELIEMDRRGPVVVDRTCGNYAVGSDGKSGVYLVWGPRGGDGVIEEIAATQQLGFNYDKLAAAKVPSKLVDGTANKDMKVVPYTEY